MTTYLEALERLGVPIVLMRPRAVGAPARPFRLREARKRVRCSDGRAIATNANTGGLSPRGLTELGDADLSEQGVMALSGHTTPPVARLYVKRTKTQRRAAARKRRAWVDLTAEPEQKGDESRNEASAGESEWTPFRGLTM